MLQLKDPHATTKDPACQVNKQMKNKQTNILKRQIKKKKNFHQLVLAFVDFLWWINYDDACQIVIF